MPSFTNNYTEPGTYVIIDDDIVTDVNTGLLSVCIIGTGKTTKSVNNELLELLPPIDASISEVSVGSNYEIGQLLTYNNKYYEVISAGTVSFAVPTVGTQYTKGTVLTYNGSYYQVQITSTIPDIKSDLEVGDTLNAGDFVLYDNKYYQITTSGTVTDPIASWLTSNATLIGEDEATATNYIITNWLNGGDVTVIANQATAEDLLIQNWLSINAQETTVNYPAWMANTNYIVGNLVTYNGLYYRCTVNHTSPDEVTDSYLINYWEQVLPIEDNYSAQLQANIVNSPKVAIDAISSKVYANSENITYFDIIDGNTFRWLAPEEKGEKVMPYISTTGKYSVTVSYTVEKNSADREPKSYTRLSSIYEAYGEPSAENTISAAAQVAYDNGATAFYCIQPEVNAVTGNIDAAGLQIALRQATKINAYCILPMVSPYDTGNTETSLTMEQIISACKTHVENMSTTLERKERIVVLSDTALLETKSIDDAIEEYKSNAASANSSRVIYITPSLVTVSLDTGVVSAANGMYAAAALSGIICNNNFTCGEPISGRTLADVTINDRYTREEKNILASYGCFVLEGAEGTSVAKIRHAISTATGDYVKSEIKITKIKDVISSTLRLALDRAYINTRFVGAATISEMTATVNTILSSFLANNDIISYSNLVIAQDLNYPNQVNVSFRIQPSVDVNYILVQFGVTFQNS